MISQRLYFSLSCLLTATLLIATQELSAGEGSYPSTKNDVVVAEFTKLRRQIARCWKVPAVTQQKDFDVHVRVQLRSDGTVRTARVVDYGWIIADDYRYSVAKSARSAILGRSCNPLLIPKDHRRSGKRFTLTFNPKAIFRRR